MHYLLIPITGDEYDNQVDDVAAESVIELDKKAVPVISNESWHKHRQHFNR